MRSKLICQWQMSGRQNSEKRQPRRVNFDGSDCSVSVGERKIPKSEEGPNQIQGGEVAGLIVMDCDGSGSRWRESNPAGTVLKTCLKCVVQINAHVDSYTNVRTILGIIAHRVMCAYDF